MSFIAVDNPDEIRLEDEDRIPAFDPPDLDYEEWFRNIHRERFRYTRFRHWGTTYYCNGTSFAAVCCGGGYSDLLLTHFRRHYTHLAVIAQFQHAALLYFSDELSSISREMAIDRTPSTGSSGWQQRLTKLQQRFLKFRTRSFFTEVSNQIQGKDLFRMWLDHLETEKLFDRVSRTSNEVYEAVENREIKELTKSQKALAHLATWGIAFSLALAVFSIVIAAASLFAKSIREQPHIPVLSNWLDGPRQWLAAGGILGVLIFGAFMLFAHLRNRDSGGNQ